jgi:Putative adhesin
MSDQEMQFADPDWKPTQPLGTKTGSQDEETFSPQPINADQREQSQWRAAPPPPHQQEAYRGIPPYMGQAPQQMQGGAFRQRPYRRGGRGLWFWIILAFIIIGLMSGGFGSAFNRFGDGGRMDQQPGGQVAPQTQFFTVAGTPTVVINDDGGAINVQTSSDSTSVVTVQATNNDGFFHNPNDAKLNASQNGNTINASVPDNGPGSADITVTVPQDSNLQLTTANGDIHVNGISGQMTLTTNDGTVQMTNDALTGQSKITTAGGDINFDGTIDKSGAYQFQSGSGSITVTLPGTPAFHLDASTNSGSIDASDFPGVHVQSNNSGSGAKANGNTGGNSPGATVTLNSDTGIINLHQASKVNSSFP